MPGHLFRSLFPALLLMLNGVVVAEASPARNEPPRQYPLEQVRISLLHQTSRQLPGGYEITITGDGKAAYVSKEERKALTLQDETLMELLNDFYRIHFFELQDTYTVKKQVSLLDNRLVSTFGHHIVDMGGKRLCIELADYKKCVTIVAGQPPEAERLAAKIRALFQP